MKITDEMLNAADSVLSRVRPGIPDETIRHAITAALSASPAGVGVETEAPSTHVAFLTMWAADIRASSGVSVDADSLESAAEAIATLSAEKERLAAELHDWRSGGAVAKLLDEIEVMRDTLSFIVTECRGASRCSEHEFGLEVISKVASNALALVGPPPALAALKGDEQ